MSLTRLISNYASYNAWAHEQIIQWLRKTDIAKLYEHVPSSFTSIDYTLQHLLRTQRYWLAFISEEETTHFKWTVREHEVENIMNELLDVTQKMKTAFSKFSETDLQKILHLRSKWATNDRHRYDYILHVINHSTYHRGQMVTIAHQLGLKEGIPNTDYNFFALPQ